MVEISYINLVLIFVLPCLTLLSVQHKHMYVHVDVHNVCLFDCYCLSPSDLNECRTGGHNCSQYCFNLFGSYGCGCRAGYTLDADGRSCTGECTLCTLICTAGGQYVVHLHIITI